MTELTFLTLTSAGLTIIPHILDIAYTTHTFQLFPAVDYHG